MQNDIGYQDYYPFALYITNENYYVVFTGKRKWASQDAKESCDETFPSVTLHRINQNSQASVSSQHNVRNPISTETQRNSHGSISQDMQAQEKMQLVSKVIKYLFAADRGKHPIQKRNIIKNALDGNTKEYRAIIDLVQTQLNMVLLYYILSSFFIEFTVLLKIKLYLKL